MKERKSIAIMQPYVFPYLGYFHLISAANFFIFYDDVNYIKQGWINRNRILINGKPFTFTIPVSNGSSFSLIKNVVPAFNEKWIDRFYKQTNQNYNKAPFYGEVVDIVMDVFHKKFDSIADLAIKSIENVFSYLQTPFHYAKSSVIAPESRCMRRADRLAYITKSLGYRHYVNAAGGKKLYSKEEFAAMNVKLSFVESLPLSYKQGRNEFVPGLSVIDCLMFNDIEHVKKLFSCYKLA
jgi:hypothetical protein